MATSSIFLPLLRSTVRLPRKIFTRQSFSPDYHCGYATPFSAAADPTLKWTFALDHLFALKRSNLDLLSHYDLELRTVLQTFLTADVSLTSGRDAVVLCLSLACSLTSQLIFCSRLDLSIESSSTCSYYVHSRGCYKFHRTVTSWIASFNRL